MLENQNLTLTLNENGQPVASSRDIAQSFEKRHDHVIRDIEAYKKDVPNFGEMFFETEIPDSYNRPQRAYLMNRDGFSLLAMGFTGSKALEWKLKYIEAFNKMEEEIRKNNAKPMSFMEMLALQVQINKELEERVSAVEDTHKQVIAAVSTPSLGRDEWQEGMKKYLAGLCETYGVSYCTLYTDLYDSLERRTGCDLEVRLRNLRKRMANAGASSKECQAVSKLSVVARDQALAGTFEAVVQKYAAKLAAGMRRG